MQSELSHAVCGAKTRAGGECRSKPMPNGRCRMHNGNAPRGIASGRYKHGRNSKYLTAIPARLQSGYKAARQRDDLLELNNEIALLDTRLADVLSRVDTGEAGKLWSDLQNALTAFQNAKAKGLAGVPEMNQHLATIESLIQQGVSDWAAWHEVSRLLEQRRKLVESERKRAVEQQEVITSQQAYLLFNALLSVIHEHVTDRDIKARIQADFIRLTSEQDSGRLRLAG